MQRITIPVFMETIQSQADTLAGKTTDPADFIIKNARLTLSAIVIFYERTHNGKPSGTIIETAVGNYSTPLTPDQLEDELIGLETDEFVQDLKQMGFKGPEDLIPPDFNDEINNMLRPGGN